MGICHLSFVICPSSPLASPAPHFVQTRLIASLRTHLLLTIDC
ncbi:hypothetical protein GXM_06850 [Nostoc sphaeroides CCNUC1]|uniref:Uncharacterized protein n=1 Tax=Nostoc sphaeroides CCNUC1 TaxID=2653204 RepID=A0A5P8WB03_9NOSO|nr:hypothetical protein GXM_06850 [Nostoc sphaeroides CCNUC1]